MPATCLKELCGRVELRQAAGSQHHDAVIVSDGV